MAEGALDSSSGRTEAALGGLAAIFTTLSEGAYSKSTMGVVSGADSVGVTDGKGGGCTGTTATRRSSSSGGGLSGAAFS